MIGSLSIILGSIVSGAIGDGLNDKGKKLIGHAFKAVEIGSLLISPFIIYTNLWLAYIASYLLIRASIFDPIYNITRGNKLSYIGDSSLWGKFLKKLKAPSYGYWFARVVLLIAGGSLLLKYL